MARDAQRADKVQNAVAFVQHIQPLGRVSDLLEDDGDRAANGIGSRDRERHALSVFIHTQDDKLSRFRFLCDIWGLYLHERDRLMQRPLGYDSVHRVSSSLDHTNDPTSIFS
ncbi:hypothetical protein SDC9_120837 [bioreactor metagenome]|uniref:Uncharacterized protein n=1 Tax=bioreactor metagenome TaxID=1076179 RepID=A0A645CAB6_9ZZZZ